MIIKMGMVKMVMDQMVGMDQMVEMVEMVEATVVVMEVEVSNG